MHTPRPTFLLVISGLMAGGALSWPSRSAGIFVQAGASQGGNGISWASAYRDVVLYSIFASQGPIDNSYG